jgi:hypothetical protein
MYLENASPFQLAGNLSHRLGVSPSFPMGWAEGLNNDCGLLPTP